jgi:hypothetical protein
MWTAISHGYQLPVASGSIIASIVSFKSSIEIGFCSTECPKNRREPARSGAGDEQDRSLPSLQEVRDRINAIAVDADVEDREVELGYHRESARIANLWRQPQRRDDRVLEP